MIRAFIALDLPAGVKTALAKVQQELKIFKLKAKWVDFGGLHITLKFLGNIPPNRVIEISALIDEVGRRHPAFNITLDQIGAFPKIDYPRVIWVGVTQGREKIAAIAQNLESILEKIGLAREKRAFHAHVTLGRLKSPQARTGLKEGVVKLQDSINLSLPVDKITLFKSTLSPAGAEYTPLHQAKLASQ